ncbi:MAG: MtnX-like HAD-IB family phosphatase [Melioribacteraceae bacterium]|nr:MtnX-like HAD-IB family phosphatase [Melioribacteraceae bacterium]MCF8353507.1 MtnX-like HAD-IB family phosphatase [Melioribacteraceae bacterium]MCF8392636.1 MtnX-like HAD-IB family phosphatase [Melioribacteraceae bacterium]MCF8418492.1 MtnX-like HAD-IB family phosphatase [Melioribacteraceae bacterium]
MTNNDRTYKVFVDFDGTITKTDVGEEMFLKFGDAEKSHEIIKRWMNDEITSVQTWQMLCKTIDNLKRNDFDNFIDTIEIDETFVDFVEFCKSNNIEITVLSDGLDYYIKRIMEKNHLSQIAAYTNQLEFTDEAKLIPHFPHTDEECDKCANCKRNHVINGSADDHFTIYIGDGYSDTCAAQYCDFIFAKNSLLKYCEINRISFFPYNNFDEIIERVKNLMRKKRLKKRHQAEIKRKHLYALG